MDRIFDLLESEIMWDFFPSGCSKTIDIPREMSCRQESPWLLRARMRWCRGLSFFFHGFRVYMNVIEWFSCILLEEVCLGRRPWCGARPECRRPELWIVDVIEAFCMHTDAISTVVLLFVGRWHRSPWCSWTTSWCIHRGPFACTRHVPHVLSYESLLVCFEAKEVILPLLEDDVPTLDMNEST